MKVKAIVIIPRLDRQFHLDHTEVFRSYSNFKGFPKNKVDAVRKGEGYGVALVVDNSQVDEDFGEQVIFLDQTHLDALIEAFKRSDELTYKHRGKGWFHGERPYFKLHDLL